MAELSPGQDNLRRFLANRLDLDGDLQSRPNAVRRQSGDFKAKRKSEAGAIAQGEAVCLGASMQAGDNNGVLLAERKHNEIAAQESSAFQVLRDGLRVFADFGELAQNFRKIDGADGRAAKQRVLDEIGARFIVEVGEKGRGIEDACRVFQSGLGCLALYFRSSVGD